MLISVNSFCTFFNTVLEFSTLVFSGSNLVMRVFGLGGLGKFLLQYEECLCSVGLPSLAGNAHETYWSMKPQTTLSGDSAQYALEHLLPTSYKVHVGTSSLKLNSDSIASNFTKWPNSGFQKTLEKRIESVLKVYSCSDWVML